MTPRILALIPAVLGLTVQLGCDKLSDPAVRLAYCMEDGIKTSQAAATSITVKCDLKLAGSYVVVLHPDGKKTDEELLADGVPADVIPELRVMRIGDNASIYVISTGSNVSGTGTGRTVLSSRTTYQNNFVRIDKLMVLAKSSQPVAVEIGGASGARVVQSIR